MILKFCLLLLNLPLKEINGCRTYLTRSERVGAHLKRSGQDGKRVAKSESRAARSFEGKIYLWNTGKGTHFNWHYHRTCDASGEGGKPTKGGHCWGLHP